MRDIDLIWQGFWDARDGDIMANLGAYEELAAVTGKPIDLFLTAWNDQFNIAGWYDPKVGRRLLRRFFHGARRMTFRQLVDEVDRLRSNSCSCHGDKTAFGDVHTASTEKEPHR